MVISPTHIRPLAERVLVRPLQREERTRGGIVLPDTAQEKPIMGKVLAVGRGRLLENGTRMSPDVREGQTILFGKFAGTEIKVADEELLLIGDRDILAVVEG